MSSPSTRAVDFDVAPAQPASDSSEASFGRRLRALREDMALSLRDLAERSGVSTAMLSQVERGDTSPTLSVARRIARGVGMTLPQLLRLDEADPITIVRARERRGVGRRGGHRYELLTPLEPGLSASVSIHRLPGDTRTGTHGDPPMHGPGSRETAVVEAGSLRLVLGEASYELGEGDAVTFDADLPHRFENSRDSEAKFLSIVTRGLRRA